MSVYEFLCKEIEPYRIEAIKLKNNYTEYRIWSISSISTYGKVTSCGKKCTARYLATPNDSDFCFDDSLYINDEDTEWYTEDFDFYKKVVGVDPRPYLNLPNEEFYEKLKQHICEEYNNEKD